MTNADKINSTAMYDVLMLMNENLKDWQYMTNALCCVLNGFRYSSECDKECSECLQRFLAADYDGRW